MDADTFNEVIRDCKMMETEDEENPVFMLTLGCKDAAILAKVIGMFNIEGNTGEEVLLPVFNKMEESGLRKTPAYKTIVMEEEKVFDSPNYRLISEMLD